MCFSLFGTNSAQAKLVDAMAAIKKMNPEKKIVFRCSNGNKLDWQLAGQFSNNGILMLIAML